MTAHSPLPDHIDGLSTEAQIAVLYERIKNLSDDVKSLRRVLWVFLSAIVSGAILFLFSVASGWIGRPTSPGSAVIFIRSIVGWLS